MPITDLQMVPVITPKQAVQQRFTTYLLQLGLGTGAALLVAYYIGNRIARGRQKLVGQVAQERQSFFDQINSVLSKFGLALQSDADRCRLRFELAEAARFLSRPFEGLSTPLSYFSMQQAYFPYITKDYPECDGPLTARIDAEDKRVVDLLQNTSPQLARQRELAAQRRDDFETLKQLPCKHRVADRYCTVNPPADYTSDERGKLFLAIRRSEAIKTWTSKNKLYGKHNRESRRRCDPRPRDDGQSDCGPHPWATENPDQLKQDNPNYKDRGQWTCKDWVNEDCDDRARLPNTGMLLGILGKNVDILYTAEEIKDRKANCSTSCGSK